MRLRDVGFVVVALCALAGFWAHEGSVSVAYSFYARMHNVGRHRYLPPPVLVSLDQGATLVAATHSDEVSLLPTAGVGQRVAVTITPSRSVSFAGNVVGLAAGCIDFPKNGSCATHIVVVTDDLQVSLYDSNLRYVWTQYVAQSPSIPVTKAACLLLPDRIYDHDRGVVVVHVAEHAEEDESSLVFALDAGTGEVRWRHVFHSTAEPETSSKLQGPVLKEADNSIQDWSRFREAVVSVMPHSFSHPWDHKVVPFRMLHTKNRKKTGQQHHGDDQPKEYHDALHTKARDGGGELGQRYAAAAKGGAKHKKRLRPLPNVVVVHSATGVYFVHLFTGRVVTQLAPLRRDVSYDDLDDNLVLDEVANDVGVAQTVFGRHGVEEEVRCDGEVRTNAPYAEDIVTRQRICETEGLLSSFGLLRNVLQGSAFASNSVQINPLERIGVHNVGDKSIQATRPIVVHTRKQMGSHIFRSERLAVFMVSKGVLTAINTRTGKAAWRTSTPSAFVLRSQDDVHDAAYASFDPTPEGKDSQLHHFPHLIGYTFHHLYVDAQDTRELSANRHRHEPLIAAVGSRYLTLVNSIHGRVEATATLDGLPIGPSVIADFNGDGTNDIVVVTATGYHGYTVQRHTSGTPTAVVLVLVLAVAAGMFVSQHPDAMALFGNSAGVADGEFEDVDDDLQDAPVLGTTSTTRRRGKRSTD